MKVDGRCLCRKIAYAATIDPGRVAICHCTGCQTRTGLVFGVVAAVVDQDFRLLSGPLKCYGNIPAGGLARALAFCPDCGTRIYARTIGDSAAFSGYARARSGSGIGCRQSGRSVPVGATKRNAPKAHPF